jgi:hypothetical protein
VRGALYHRAVTGSRKESISARELALFWRVAWNCPTCGRAFARARQSHSCGRTTIDAHFAGKRPELRRIFDRLAERLAASGPLRVDAVKTSIHLISGRAFGGVTVARESLRLGFLSPRAIKSPRIVKRVMLAPDRIEHVVVVDGIADVDRELLGWLSASQKFRL